jgi:hypothetical protein
MGAYGRLNLNASPLNWHLATTSAWPEGTATLEKNMLSLPFLLENDTVLSALDAATAVEIKLALSRICSESPHSN